MDIKLYDIFKNNFIKINRESKLTLNANILYSYLMAKSIYYKKEYSKKEYFVYTNDKLQEETSLSKYQQLKAIEELKNKNLISITYSTSRGLKRYRMIKVNKYMNIDNFETFNPQIAKILGIKKTLILSAILRGFQYTENDYGENNFINTGILISHDGVYFSVKSLQEQTTISKTSQERYITELYNSNLISLFENSLRYIYITEENESNIISLFINAGIL